MDVQEVLSAESVSHNTDEWFDMDSPMDSTMEISADGGEQDLFSVYTQEYGYFLPSSRCCLSHCAALSTGSLLDGIQQLGPSSLCVHSKNGLTCFPI